MMLRHCPAAVNRRALPPPDPCPSPRRTPTFSDTIEVQNVGQPGKTYRADATKYAEMRAAMEKVLPTAPPGVPVADLIEEVKPHLSPTVFPGGETAGWWVKCVQLDLEAKGLLKRGPKPPVRLCCP
ncbi:DUF6958 family protein [Tabrizicola sp.]|uniref:DUF6958 family protein n=1 Tax=Tabrizicola sp. TaxID=2005166 RepID=UPI003F3D9408